MQKATKEKPIALASPFTGKVFGNSSFLFYPENIQGCSQAENFSRDRLDLGFIAHKPLITPQPIGVTDKPTSFDRKNNRSFTVADRLGSCSRSNVVKNGQSPKGRR